MKKRLLAFTLYAFFWLMFFFFARMFFLLFQHNNTLDYQLPGILGTFIHGIKLDISTISYYLIIPLLLAIPGLWFSGKWFKYIIDWYTFVLVIFSSIIMVTDASLYSYWGFRMDYTPFFYLKTPGEAIASVNTMELLSLTGLMILTAAFFIFFYKRFVSVFFENLARVRPIIPAVIFFLILWGALIIPIRGGFGVAPINAGSVYFSNQMFLNHASINAVWNVGTTAFTHKPTKNPYQFTDKETAAGLAASLTELHEEPVSVLNNKRPNILMIVLESFSGYVIGPLEGDSLVSPEFNKLAKEGILFSNFYASGTRTDKAMPAILAGYPAQPAESIIKEPKKSQTLPSIVKTLVQNGYNTSFWYGGEIDFANFNSYVIGSGFQEILTKDNFSSEYYNSKWGVHDHILFNNLKESMDRNISQPFFKVVLTLSSHEPFDIPEEPFFTGKDNLDKYRSSVYYSDKALGSFITWAKTKDWWKNTLVILVADHCCRISAEVPAYSPELFRIPMVWLGGAIRESGLKIEKTGSQVDIPPTLFNQLGLKESFPFGKDLLSASAGSFAFYTYNEGFGFITDSSRALYDHKLKSTVLKEGKSPDLAEKYGKAYLQALFEDYLKR